MEDRIKVFVIKLLLYLLFIGLKLQNFRLRFKIFFLKFKNFRMKVSILRLKLVRQRYYRKKLGCNFSIVDAIRELRYQINNVFGGTHV